MPYGDDVLFTLKVRNDPANRAAFQQLAALAQPISQQIQSQINSAINRGVQQGVNSARNSWQHQPRNSQGQFVAQNYGNPRAWPGMSGLSSTTTHNLGGAWQNLQRNNLGQFVSPNAGINPNTAAGMAAHINQVTGALNQNTRAVQQNAQQVGLAGRVYNNTASAAANLGNTIQNHLLTYFTVSTIADFTMDVVRLGAELERTQVRFEVLAGSQQKADRLIGQLRTLSSMSGTSFSSLSRGAGTMLGYGTGSDLTGALMKPINVVTAGDNGAAQRMTVAVSQILGMGRLQKQEVNQLINAGFNPLRAVSKLLNKDLEEVRDMMKSGAISAEVFAEALLKVVESGGQYDGLLEKMADTTAGKLNRVATEWEKLKTSIGQSEKGITGTIATDMSSSMSGLRFFFEGPPKSAEEALRRQLETFKQLKAASDGGFFSNMTAEITTWMHGSSVLDLPKQIEAYQKIVDQMDKFDINKGKDPAELARKRIEGVYETNQGKAYDKMVESRYGDNAERVLMLREQSVDKEREMLDLMIQQGRPIEEMLRVVSEQTRIEDQRLKTNLEITKSYESQKELQKGLVKSAEDVIKLRDDSRKRLTTGAENFADMSLLDKQQAINAKQKLDTQGFGALNKDERDVLSKLGLKDTDDAVRSNKLKEADSFGFSQYFGSSERDAIQKSEAAIAKLDIETKIELQGKIEIDDSKLMDQTLKALEDYQIRWEKRLRQVLSEDRQKNGVNNLQARHGQAF